VTLTDEQVARINAIIKGSANKITEDKSAVVEAAKNSPKSSSMFGASSGVPRSSGGVEAKTKSDAVAAAALKNASPAEILAAWTAAQTSNGGDPDAAFLEAFKTGRK
jgi:hypothetical protein